MKKTLSSSAVDFDTVISNEFLRVKINRVTEENQPQFFLAAVEVKTDQGWQALLTGIEGKEFVTSSGYINATSCNIHKTPDGETQLLLSGQSDVWDAQEVITLLAGQPVMRREQTYQFNQDWVGSVYPGFQLQATEDIRYTYPVQVHEIPLTGVPALRFPADWAVPFPFHVWHNQRWVGLYGLDKNVSAGTIAFVPPARDGLAELRVYYPDSANTPDQVPFAAGAKLTLTEIIAAKVLSADNEPLLEAERLAASILLSQPARQSNLNQVADGIAEYYQHCGLWEPDALGPGRGWFSNMWVRTQTGPAKKRGDYSGYFDLGWGEGIAVEMWLGAVRYWRRTGNAGLLSYVDEMTRNMDLFKRGPAADAPYFDRSDGVQFGDFLIADRPGQRIWTHSLGHTGSQLIQLYLTASDYPNLETQNKWRAATASIAIFLAKHQRDNGDLQDGFDEQDHELNKKSHRITARAVVCGLWARMAEITGDSRWTDRALRLAKAVAPEIQRYEYYNQMIDAFFDPKLEPVDGEAAYYVLEGLVPLYSTTHNPEILALCKKAAAFGIAWTYFYDLPHAKMGIARGGQCCRTDIPLLYPVGPAKGIGPFLELAKASGDLFFEQMAAETAAFISNWQIKASGQPWDGAIVHALQQYSGKHWGPDLAGQVDTGVATGNSLAAIELWLEHLKLSRKGE